VAFSIAGFVLADDPDLLGEAKNNITEAAPVEMGEQLNDLIDQAINSRTTVGVIGLLGALYSGLGWMANLREALTAQWEQVHEKASFIKTKLGDLAAMIGLALALVVSLALSAVGDGDLLERILRPVGRGDAPGIGILLQVASLVLAVIASWAVFTWVIARLPREPVSVRSAVRAGLMSAIIFEIFKRIAAFYLKSILSSPAGVAFGAVLGLMVFFFFTFRIILFATAWAATAEENLDQAAVPPPDPAIITTRVTVNDGHGVWGGLTLLGIGALTALGIRGVLRRPQRRREPEKR